MEKLLEIIRGFPKPPRRERTKPMQVLCVGISRSGTESLNLALRKIGLDTYHGWDMVAEENGGYLEEWYRLMQRKYKGAPDGDVNITTDEFDALLGSAEALIDIPTYFFAPELIQAYPDAKVILNTRTDLDAWHRSVVNALVTKIRGEWWIWIVKHLSAESFWLNKFTDLGTSQMFHSPIPNTATGLLYNGKWVYRDYCNMIRGLVPKERLLEWSVEDGWEPLCEFLGKPCPDEPFPNSNNFSEFVSRVDRINAMRAKKAMRRLLVLVPSVGVGIAAIVLGFRRWRVLNPLSWVQQGLKYFG